MTGQIQGPALTKDNVIGALMVSDPFSLADGIQGLSWNGLLNKDSLLARHDPRPWGEWLIKCRRYFRCDATGKIQYSIIASHIKNWALDEEVAGCIVFVFGWPDGEICFVSIFIQPKGIAEPLSHPYQSMDPHMVITDEIILAAYNNARHGIGRVRFSVGISVHGVQDCCRL